LLLVALDGRIIEANQAAVELYGYSRDELLTQRIYALRQDDPEVVDLQMSQAKTKGTLFESIHVCKDGARVPVEVSSRAVFIDGKTMLLSVIRDIRQRKETEHTLRRAKEEAENANRAKSGFLAAMSHELRTPLNAIMGFSQVLAQEYFGPLTDKQKEYATDIYQSGKHLLSLINDILDLSKIEAGKMEPQWSCFAIDTLLEQSRTLVREKCFKHNIALSYEIAPNVRDLMITADERRVKQILYNLLSNATKFTPDNGSIRVQAQLTEDPVPMLEVAVSDTGIGISPEHQAHIFDAFYQVQGGTVNKTPGTGLGLCLVRQYVMLNGGSIRVESEGEGRGSRFILRLPVDARAAMPGQPDEKGEP
jgi:PAS domain S-box-containing protein